MNGYNNNNNNNSEKLSEDVVITLGRQRTGLRVKERKEKDKKDIRGILTCRPKHELKYTNYPYVILFAIFLFGRSSRAAIFCASTCRRRQTYTKFRCHKGIYPTPHTFLHSFQGL